MNFVALLDVSILWFKHSKYTQFFLGVLMVIHWKFDRSHDASVNYEGIINTLTVSSLKHYVCKVCLISMPRRCAVCKSYED